MVPPKFKTPAGGLLCASWYGEGAVGVSAPARPLSFLLASRVPFSGGDPLCGRDGLEYCCGVVAVNRCDYMRFWGKCQGGPAEGAAEGGGPYGMSYR